MTNTFILFCFSLFFLDLSKYASSNIGYVLNSCCGNFLLLILVYVYSCFFLLHHIDIYKQQGVYNLDYLILLDLKKRNSDLTNITVDIIVFNNVQCMNIKVCCTCSTVIFLIIYWWITKQYKGLEQNRVNRAQNHTHSYILFIKIKENLKYDSSDEHI